MEAQAMIKQVRYFPSPMVATSFLALQVPLEQVTMTFCLSEQMKKEKLSGKKPMVAFLTNTEKKLA